MVFSGQLAGPGIRRPNTSFGTYVLCNLGELTFPLTLSFCCIMKTIITYLTGYCEHHKKWGDECALQNIT